jgi:Flp pilus assembly pilin Flp
MLEMIQGRIFAAFVGLKDRAEGQALVEYTLILALVSLVAVALLGGIGNAVVVKLTDVKNSI